MDGYHGMLPRKISLDALRVFEAAGRHLSFTKAAAELRLTQGAVSQRIKALEENLGAPLFRRLTRALELTPNGQQLHIGLQEAFARIAAGLAGFRSKGTARPLRLTVSSSVATRWLLPRLGELAGLKPALSVAVFADDRLAEIGVEADVALRFGRGRYRGLKSERIGGDEVFPVCSPSFLDRHPGAADFGIPAQRKVWGQLPRLVDSVTESDGSGCDWGTWGKSAGLSWSEEDRTIVFSQGHLALQAAAEGMGVALARRILAADDLASGRLVRAGHSPSPLPARFGYYFVTRTEPDARARSLAAWLKAQLQSTRTQRFDSNLREPVRGDGALV
jgi:LysR family transcriptional regulator, glycine cleavage system transcriptional activator